MKHPFGIMIKLFYDMYYRLPRVECRLFTKLETGFLKNLTTFFVVAALCPQVVGSLKVSNTCSDSSC